MTVNHGRRACVAVLSAALALLPAMGTPQPVPGKQVRMILTYPPGGASDIMGRIMAQKLGEVWGQTVLVENRAGANGAIGIEYAARHPAAGPPFVTGISHRSRLPRSSRRSPTTWPATSSRSRW